jgi:hypothetical protein
VQTWQKINNGQQGLVMPSYSAHGAPEVVVIRIFTKPRCFIQTEFAEFETTEMGQPKFQLSGVPRFMC